MASPDDTSPAKTLAEISNERTFLVGSYIITWNMVELQFQVFASTISGLGLQTISTLLANASVPTNMGIFKALVAEKLKIAELATIAESCADKLMAMSNFRNEVAHGKWIVHQNLQVPAVDGDGQTVSVPTLISSKTPFALDLKKQVTVKDLESELGNLNKLLARVHDLSWRFQAHLNPGAFSLPSPWHGKF